MKESRPDKTGVWRSGSIVDDCDGDYSEQYPYGVKDNLSVIGTMFSASIVVDKAIEKMIASAREKGR